MPTYSSISSTIETPVLVIGAGIAGLTLAADLGLRGVPFVLAEESPDSPDEPRAWLRDTRSMEWMRRAGVADAVRAAALGDDVTARLYCTSIDGYEIAHLDGTRREIAATPEKAVRCNWAQLAPILRELASSQTDARLRFRWRLERLEQRGDCILADVIDLAALERRRIAAQYVVDCSGAAATIREAHGLVMNLPRETEAFAQLHLHISGLARLFERGLPAETVLVDPKGLLRTLESLDGRDRFRLRLDGEEAWETYETVDPEALVFEIAGRPVSFQLLSRGRWKAGNAVAANWREGNILLAGDAAHQFVPSSSIGLGIAIGDAADLAWKLEARLAGWGSSGIIDAYAAERGSVAQRLVEMLDQERRQERESRPLEVHADIALDTPAGRASRKVLGKTLEERHGRTPSFDRLATATSYAGSPIVAGDRAGSHAPPMARRLAALIGTRAPHMLLPGGGSTLDLYGRGFVLLRLGRRAPEPGGLDRAFAHRGMPLSIRSFDDPSMAELHGARLVLVRPDGHVAWAGDEPPGDPLAIADRLRGAA